MKRHTATLTLDEKVDTVSLFRSTAQVDADAVLLESSTRVGKKALKSLLFVKNAVRVECRGNNVTLVPLSPNGRHAITEMLGRLKDFSSVDASGDRVVALFSDRCHDGPESERISAVSTADVIRLACYGWDQGSSDTEPMQVPVAFAFDYVEQFEKLPRSQLDVHDFPDYVFWLPEHVINIDHSDSRAKITVNIFGDDDLESRFDEAQEQLHSIADTFSACRERRDKNKVPANPPASLSEPGTVRCSMDDVEFATMVWRLKRHISEGDVFQIVPSRTFSLPCSEPLESYEKLGSLNPSPWQFYMRTEAFTLFGSSPEVCVRVTGDSRLVEIHPIAGTRRRGFFADGSIDTDLDNRLEAELRLNEKELAEHMMLLDLARNDVARISNPGSRSVRRLLEVDRYSHVMHLVSVVEGRLRDDLDPVQAYVASMNMGTVTGAPKIMAARLLRKYEKTRRGPYGGGVGYIDTDGNMETAIFIRSALVKDGTAFVRAGAGVVFDSDPEAEAAETADKAGAVLSAVSIAEGGAS